MSILVVVLAVYSSFCLLLISPQYTQTYISSLIDKVERLESINKPKIILVGNSNLAFGINSKTIEDTVGMPVVNLGLHGGLGNKFHEEIAKYNINKGDSVIVCHTTYSDNGMISNHVTAWTAIENYWKLYSLISKDDWKQMVLTFPNYTFKALIRLLMRSNNPPKTVNTAYMRAAFNEYGDINYPRTTNEYTFTKTSVGVPGINSTCINRLNEFNKYCNEKGATLLVAGYPIGYGEFTPDKKLFIDFWERLKKELDCTVISNIEDYFIEYKYFYDTPYHLTDEGAKIRTNQLIEDLKNYNIEHKSR